MTFAYPRGLRGPIAQDVLLVIAWLAGAFLVESAPLRSSLLVAIPVVLAWGVVTLHFPSRIEIDDDGVGFCHYGRVHRFAWSSVSRLHVRRFLVRDRVLVRLEPRRPWQGRYWLVDSIVGFDALVAALEDRGRSPSRLRR